MRWLILSLLLTVGVACANTKVVLNAVAVRGEFEATEADAVGRALTNALARLDDVTVTTVRSADGLSERHAGYAAGELAPQIAAATGADWVVFPTICGQPDALLCLAAYDRSAKVIRLFEPALLPAREADRRDVVGQTVALALQRWRAAAGSIVGLDGNGLLGIRLLASPGQGRGPYRVAVQPAVISVEATGERLAPPPLTVARGTLIRTDDATAWFELAEGQQLQPGTAVVVAPEAALPAGADARGAVVTSRPRGAAVIAAGRTWGATPVWLPEAVLADQNLELRHPEALPWRRVVMPGELAAGLVAAELPLSGKVPAGVGPQGVRLRVESVPPGAEVRLDGVPKGLTPLDLDGVIGRPEVTVHRSGFEVWRAQVVATGPLTLKAELVSAFGQLEVTSQPSGAQVFVDGQKQGATPLGLSGVPVGKHDLRVVAPNGDERVRQVVVEPAGVTRTAIKFDDGPAPLGAEGAVPEPLQTGPPPEPPIFKPDIQPQADVPPVQPPVARPEASSPPPQAPRVDTPLPPESPLEPPSAPEPQAVLPPVTQPKVDPPRPAEPQADTPPAPPLTRSPESLPRVVPPQPQPPIGTVKPGAVASPRRPQPQSQPAAQPPVEAQPFQPEPPPPQPDPSEPVTAGPIHPAPFQAGAVLWQMKLDSLGGRMYLVAARYDDGVVFSVTLSPPRTYLTGPAERGFRLVYPGSTQKEGWAFALDEVPEIDAIRLEPDKDRHGALAILLDLASGVVAKVHETSTLERARIICRHPSSSARPVAAGEP